MPWFEIKEFIGQVAEGFLYVGILSALVIWSIIEGTKPPC